MRKEILFAIVAGGIFGLIIAFGVWRANIALKPSPTETATESSEVPTSEFGISIAKPLDTQVITDAPIVFTGITQPDAWIAISAEDKDYIFQADEEGSFEQEIDLDAGVNEIIVIAFDDEGNSVEQRLTLVYSTAFGKQIEPDQSLSTPEATAEGETIRDKVQEKIAKAKNIPVSFIGTVTDISESTLQIKNDKEEIKQVSVDEKEATFVKVTKTSKEVSFKDVAIGDFIIAMGFANGNGVLEAKRVLITSPIETSNRRAIYGSISEISKKTVVLDTSDGQWSAEFGKRWVGPELDELNEGDKIIVAGTTEGKILEVRTLFIIPKESSSPVPEVEE